MFLLAITYSPWRCCTHLASALCLSDENFFWLIVLQTVIVTHSAINAIFDKILHLLEQEFCNKTVMDKKGVQLWHWQGRVYSAMNESILDLGGGIDDLISPSTYGGCSIGWKDWKKLSDWQIYDRHYTALLDRLSSKDNNTCIYCM